MSEKTSVSSGRQGLERENAAKQWFEQLLKTKFTSDIPFGDIVKDGEILCRCIATINDSLIPKINEKPSRSFLAKENLHFFLGACEELGVPRYLLPGVDDIYNAKNVMSVVECIEALVRFFSPSCLFEETLSFFSSVSSASVFVCLEGSSSNL